jgi:dCTP deaminase
MILTASKIKENIDSGDIIIKPFYEKNINPNSYDVHLGSIIGEYNSSIIDAKTHNEIRKYKIPDQGLVLMPDSFYLATTLEFTETKKHVPMLDGKSSIGRLGIDIHATAGKGDIGFAGHWTLEISVKKPVRIYAGMPIGQIIYYVVDGDIDLSYKETGSYNNVESEPVESMLFKKFK